MKAQLVVVHGKPVGKTIPLVGPVFRIGRGETCHLRPNSDEVSREHAEFTVKDDSVILKDLGSRNGTLVNGKALTEPYVLHDRDQIEIGPLVFAVSIEGAAGAKAFSPADYIPIKSTAPIDPETETTLPPDVAALLSDAAIPTSSTETVMVAAFKDAPGFRGVAPFPGSDDGGDDEYERQGEGDVDVRLVDAPSPAFRKKSGGKPPSNASTEILRKMMERRRASK